MTRGHRTIEHTADIGLEAWGDSLADMMAGLAEGLAELVCPPRHVQPLRRVQLRVQAEDPEALAVDFLSAVLGRVQVDRFVVHLVEARQDGPCGLEAVLVGEPYDPSRHELEQEIKAVTYHQVRAVCEGGRWLGRVFLDI